MGLEVELQESQVLLDALPDLGLPSSVLLALRQHGQKVGKVQLIFKEKKETEDESGRYEGAERVFKRERERERERYIPTVFGLGLREWGGARATAPLPGLPQTSAGGTSPNSSR